MNARQNNMQTISQSNNALVEANGAMHRAIKSTSSQHANPAAQPQRNSKRRSRLARMGKALVFGVATLAATSLGLAQMSTQFGSPQIAQQPQPIPMTDLSIEVYLDDWNSVVPNQQVSIGRSNFVADAAGLAGPKNVRSTQTHQIRLGEVPTNYGETIGQQFNLKPSALVGSGVDDLIHAYYQPEARTVFIDPFYRSFDYVTTRWSIQPITDGTFNGFYSKIGFLNTKAVINATRRYVGDPKGNGHQAVFFRTDQANGLGDGLEIRIDTAGYTYVNEPSVELQCLGGCDLRGLSASVMDYSSKDDLAHVQLDGILPAGDVIVYLTGALIYELEPTPLGSSPNPSTSPQFGSPTVDSASYGAGYDPVSPFGSEGITITYSTTPDCEPPAPDCSSSPDCTPPTPNNDCGAYDTGTTDLTSAQKVGSKLCASKGSGLSEQKCRSWSGGASVKVGIDDVVEVGIDGSVSGSRCTTLSASGGYCAQAWLCLTKKRTVWEVCKESFWTGEYWTDEITYCGKDGGTTSTTCQ